MSITPYPSNYTAQPADLTLSALAELATAPDTAPYFTGVDSAALMTVTPFIRTLLDDPDLASAQLTLGIAGAGLTVEQVQDLVAAMFPLSATLEFTYNDPAGTIDANVRVGGVTENHLSLSDVTTDNATTGQHGFLPKLSGVATEYLNGVGGFSTPAGGGGEAAPTSAISPFLLMGA